MEEFKRFSDNPNTYKQIVFGMGVYIVQQISGELRSESRVPYLVIFGITNLWVMCSIPHKEFRFLSAIFPLFCLFWANSVVAVVSLEDRILRSLMVATTKGAMLKTLVKFWVFKTVLFDLFLMSK